MNISLAIQQPQWRTVYTIPKGTALKKGRRHKLYKDITKAAGAVTERFGCYSWGSDTIIFYCGSFAKDYSRGGFKTNLHGRVHNYLQSHGLAKFKRTGRKNTNLMVFDNINKALCQNDILLRLFTFEELEIGNDKVDFVTFSTDPNLVHTVEQLLICTYRRQDQCKWNRT